MDARLEQAPFGVLEVTSGGTVEAANQSARRLLGMVGETVAGADLRSVSPASVDATLPAIFETTGPPPEREFEEYYPDLDRWLAVSVVPPVDGTEDETLVYLEDVSDRRGAERAVDRLHGELDRLAVVDRLISDVLSELVDASSREAIAETVCDRLGSTDVYEFAWFGERDVGSDRIVVRASAGATGRTLDRIREALEDSQPIPEAGAVETGSVRVTQPLAEDRSIPEPIRRAAFADGLQSLLAIPLTHGESVYGVVGVYAGGQEGFSERERASFQTVGEMAGFAVNAARHRNLLLSDTVVELTMEVNDSADPLLTALDGMDAQLSVEGTVLRGGDGLVCYVAVDGAPPSAVAATVAGADGVDETRVVNGGDGDDAGSIEVGLDGGTPLGRLATRGVTPRVAVYRDGTGRIVAELSPDEDTRRVIKAVTRPFEADVVAKRERERSVTTINEFRDGLRDRLTERQETALRTALYADYFESPRGSTAEEVAGVLDITGSTLLYHLRAGQRKLLDEVFERESPRGDDPSPG